MGPLLQQQLAQQLEASKQAREKTPIYLKPASDKFRWGDGDWWASNGVSVVSSISMFLPGLAAVKGIGAVGGGLRRLNAATKGLKGAKTNAAIANSLNLSRTAKWLSNSTIMGLSSRHMENYREAAETFKVGYDKNFEYFGNPEKLDAYLKSADGQSMLDKLGLTRDSRNLRETAAKHIAGKSAAKSYNMNYANLGFDIAQSALFFRGVGRSTRAGIFGHSKPVKGAQNAVLKNPKLPKTRFGKVLAATPRTRHWAFWSGTEGVEEMWNFVSMQEGIHYGDVLAGNTGWENRDFIDGTFADRLNRYANDGEMWTAAFMGAIGGGIFTGVSSWKNAKAQKARDAEAIKEINNRVDVLRESLKKRQKAQQRGDINGMKEQDELLALEMALNAARTGTTDLLVDMLGDPIYEELLGEYGISGDQVASNRQSLIDTILKTEKKFNKYVNKITGKKYSYGVANALTNMDMAVDIYQNLINSVEDQINNLDESDAFTQKQFGIGPNTKRRYELKAKREAIQAQIDIEQERIESAYDRIQPAIDEQNAIIQAARTSDSERTQPYEEQLTALDEELRRLDAQATQYESRIAQLSVDASAVDPVLAQIDSIENAIVKVEGQLASRERDQIASAQRTIGANADGNAGPNTRRSADTWITQQRARIGELQAQVAQLRATAQSTVDAERTRLTNLVSNIRNAQTQAVKDRQLEVLATIDQVRNTESPVISKAREEVQRIRAGADAQIAQSNTLIQSLRNSLTVGKDAAVEATIAEQQEKIVLANNTIDTLTEQKYTLQTEYRKLEAEVGPVKYLAEFVYGDTADKDILEEAVRWVIITIIFVFDPLAVLLLIASQATFEMRRNTKAGKEKYNDNTNRLDDGQQVKETRSETSTSTRASKQSSNDTASTEPDDELPGTDVFGGMLPRRVLEERKQDLEERELYDNTYKENKQAWKQENPNDTVKYYKERYIQGRIDHLPWEDYDKN